MHVFPNNVAFLNKLHAVSRLMTCRKSRLALNRFRSTPSPCRLRYVLYLPTYPGLPERRYGPDTIRHHFKADLVRSIFADFTRLHPVKLYPSPTRRHGGRRRQRKPENTTDTRIRVAFSQSSSINLCAPGPQRLCAAAAGHSGRTSPRDLDQSCEMHSD